MPKALAQGRTRPCESAAARDARGRGEWTPHNLPDAVFALHGPPSAPIDLEVVVRIDSSHGGLRATVAGAPDAPVTRAIVNMQGGKKGLFVNSTNLCLAKHRARVNAKGQNGRRALLHPLVRPKCGHRKVHRKHHKKRSRR